MYLKSLERNILEKGAAKSLRPEPLKRFADEGSPRRFVIPDDGRRMSLYFFPSSHTGTSVWRGRLTTDNEKLMELLPGRRESLLIMPKDVTL